MTIDLSTISRELKKPVEQIESAVKLLDEGNTIPFITRFRKDQTGGFNEEQLLVIKQSVTRLRALAERKAFILKSIDSQGKLTDELKAAVESADSSRKLEDIYLPYKPRKQSLATVARQNGLEPLANDIYEGREPDKDLASRATDFVRVDRNLNSIDDVIAGVGHILAERFSDNIELRNELRAIIQSQGKLSTRLIAIESESEPTPGRGDSRPNPVATPKAVDESKAAGDATTAGDANDAAETKQAGETSGDETRAVQAGVPADEETAAQLDAAESAPDSDQNAAPQASADAGSDPVAIPARQPEQDAAAKPPLSESSEAAAVQLPDGIEASAPSDKPSTDGATETTSPPTKSAAPLKKKRKKKKSKPDDPYREFKEFSCPVATIPYYKTLAINRGEKNGRIRVRIEFDETRFLERACQILVPADHPFAEFLKTCVKDSMTRLVMPSLEREARREITEAAERHAVRVFARNLKNLLLQSPVRNQGVLAIDPGYKRGCSVAVIDAHGQLLDHEHIFVVGNQSRLKQSAEKLIELIRKHGIQLIAIGNGAACREAEQLVSDLIAEHFEAGNLKYAMVNEAGASVYSTSEVGREELPDLSPAVRSAVSIGRRLIDPLSELVKISPAHIGVGLYQHDVKAKHLAESLDDVVQFCVNRVGVDVNTASPSLLKYISGLNQLTARRVYEYRQSHGPFSNREQLKQVAGFGDATFIQSAGFLRIRDGDQPLDATAIHPESYPTAINVFEKVGASVKEIFPAASSAHARRAANAADATREQETDQPSSPPHAQPTSTQPESSAEQEQVAEQTGSSAMAHATSDDSNEQMPAQSIQPADDAETPAESEQGSHSSAAAANEDAASSTVSQATWKPASAEGDPTEPIELTTDQLERRKELVKAIRELDPGQLAKEMQIGQLMLRDILNSICRPEFDPRNNINRPVFRSGILKIADLKKEMCLDGQVVNVVDFGVFVDIGLGTSCLVHVSQLANHFIRDPHRFFSVGDIVKVWVTDIDTDKRRVTLTAVQPAALRPKREEKRGGFRKRGPQKSGQDRAGTRGYAKRVSKPRRKPAPKAPPITDEMLKGSEPMRSFSDLAQFYDKQAKPSDKKPKD